MLNIIDNSLNGIKFAELGTGATFKYSDYYYMVTEQIAINNWMGKAINAIRLDNGEFASFESGDIVVPFNCELIVL